MAKTHPKGETPDEARERIVPTPATFSLSLSGAGDHANADELRIAFATFIQAARAAGFNPTGALVGSTTPFRGDDGEIVPGSESTFHDSAGDIALEEDES